MNSRVALFILMLSALFSSWLYWGSDVKIEQVLTAGEWQTNLDTYVLREQVDESISSLHKAHITSNIKYLSNGTYLRESRLQLFKDQVHAVHTIHISENGTWELSDNYLLINPKEFKDTATAEGQELTESQLHLIKQLFITDAQQSRRIDIINKKSILLTSLGYGSRVLVSN